MAVDPYILAQYQQMQQYADGLKGLDAYTNGFQWNPQFQTYVRTVGEGDNAEFVKATPAELASIQSGLSRYMTPMEIDATGAGDKNPWGMVPKSGYRYNTFGIEGVLTPADEQNGMWANTEGYTPPNYTAEQMTAQANAMANGGRSLLTNQQLYNLQQIVKMVPGAKIDALGRPIFPGTKVWDNGGYMQYGQTGESDAPDQPGYKQPDFGWTWVPAEHNGVPASPKPPDSVWGALVNSGVEVKESMSGGLLGQGGMNGIAGAMIAAGPIVNFASGGGLAAALADQLASTGMNETAAEIAANAAVGAGKNAITSGGNLQSTLTGGVQGGLGGYVNDTINSGVEGLGNLFDGTTGNGLDMTDMNMAGVPDISAGIDNITPPDISAGLGTVTDGGTPMGDTTFDMTDMTMPDTSFDMTDMTMDPNDPNAIPYGDTGGFDWTKLIAPGIKAGLGLAGTIAGTTAASNASQAQVDAANRATGLAAAQYAQNRADFQPYLQEGYSGLNKLKTFDQMQGLGALPSYQTEVTDQLKNYNADPATIAQKALGQQGLQRQLNARGLNYGATGASAGAQLNQQYDATGYDKYKGDLANRYGALQSEYATRYGQNSDAYNKIMNSIKVGQGAAGTVSGAGQNYVNNATQNINNAGTATANGDMAIGAQLSNFATGLGKLYNNMNTNPTGGTTNTNNGWWGN